MRSKHFTKQSKRYTSLLTAFVSRAKKKREATTGNTARRPERVIPEIISEKYRIVVPRMLESFLRSREELIFRITVAHKGHETPAIYFGKFEW